MLRTLSHVFVITCLACNSFALDPDSTATCTIVNPENQPVVIGIYRPSASGIGERLVAVPPKTQIHDIPVDLTEDEQFAIAYKAEADGNEIKRTIPIKLYGHKRINVIAQKRDADTPDVLIHFRGYDETFGDLRDQNRSLYIPSIESEAKRVVRDANRKSSFVDDPLVKSAYSTN